ncbi:hypothetical protein ACX1C1_26705 [Paenibacillus sp. strain BS8-2]
MLTYGNIGVSYAACAASSTKLLVVIRWSAVVQYMQREMGSDGIR